MGKSKGHATEEPLTLNKYVCDELSMLLLICDILCAWLYQRNLSRLTCDFHFSRRKDQKKVSKLESMIPYYEARKEDTEVQKLNSQIEAVWAKARAARDMGLSWSWFVALRVETMIQ